MPQHHPTGIEYLSLSGLFIGLWVHLAQWRFKTDCNVPILIQKTFNSYYILYISSILSNFDEDRSNNPREYDVNKCTFWIRRKKSVYSTKYLRNGVHPKRPQTKTATTRSATYKNGHRLKRPQSATKTATFTQQMKSHLVIKFFIIFIISGLSTY